jgi:hypothetical protein
VVRAIDHCMTYDELWSGRPLPPIASPLSLPIADEIATCLDSLVMKSHREIRGWSAY